MTQVRAPRRTVLVIGGALLVSSLLVPASAALAATSVSYTFDAAGDLATGFDSYVASGVVAQTLTGGLSNTGAINAPGSANAVFTSRAGYSMGPVGSTYTFSSFLQSVGNSGYSGMGFTSLTASAASASGTPYRPIDALGISVHGGGFVFHNGATNLSGSWNSSSNAGITTVTPATIFDLLNNGSTDKWYKVILVITRDSATTFDMRVEIWPSSSTGVLLNSSASAIFEVQNATNSTISTAPVIHSYINFSGDRVRYFDAYNVEVAGGASVIEAGAPVVLTSSASATGAEVVLAGIVTDSGTAPVSARGFAYSTSPSPTVSNSVVGAGTGTGSFTGSTPALAPGTYYFRAFATSTIGTSYGSEVQVVVAAGQTITFAQPADQVINGAPLVVAPTATSGLTPVLTSGTTAVCTVAGFTITFMATGECTVTANQPGDGTYDAATPVARSFDITLVGQTITFALPSDVSLADPTLALTASTDAAGLTPALTSATPAVCTMSGASVSFVTTGLCTITASQSGNGTYAAAAPVDRSFRVIEITTRSLISMTAGAAGSQQLTVAGAAGGGMWSTSTPLPAGLSLSAATGLLSGTPAAAFSGSITFTYTENGVAHNVSLLLDIRSGSALARTGTDSNGLVVAGILLLLLGGVGVSRAMWRRHRVG